jgi:hypothetical protein
MQSAPVRLIAILALFTSLTFPAFPQGEDLLPGDAVFDPAVPPPEEYFGFPIGEWHLQPDQIRSYLLLLAERSNRLTIEEYGKTHENRPLLLLTFTSAENHQKIHEIRERHLRALDPGEEVNGNTPVVVWMGYSIHGNEPSGSNAAPLVAYYLASAQNSRVEQWLSDMVILMDPMSNPDGLNRFALWANMHKGKQLVADPASREHQEAWPGGRTNHYWFDLNRDWMPVRHPETAGRLAKYYEWLPGVLTDHHEMDTDATFFFQPGVPTRINPRTPAENVDLTNKLAGFHARALDRAGALYFTGERFDDFYIGKGSSYPDITGSVGILFEQASSRGHLQESVNGPLRFSFTIRNQILTSLSTLEGVHELRDEIVAYQRNFFRSALREGAGDPVQAYVFSAGSDGARMSHFVDLLRRHRIEVFQLGKDVRVSGQNFSAGSSAIVPTRQRQYRLIQALFEKRTEFQDSLFYDVSTWTLPIAFGLSFAALSSDSRDLYGPGISSPLFPRGSLEGGESPYAYAIEWNAYYAPRALYRMLKAGLRVRVATHPFSAESVGNIVRFGYGSVVVPSGIQPVSSDSVRRVMHAIAGTDEIPVYGLDGGMSVHGVDLGSPSLKPISLPSVMMVVGSGISAIGVGEVWNVLDERFGMEVSLVEYPLLSRADLSRYSVILLADGNYAGIDSAGRTAMRRWVEAGGTLIAMEDAITWVIRNDLAQAVIRKEGDAAQERRAYASASNFAGARKIAGAICRVTADRTHPLLFGYTDSVLNVFRASNVFLEPSENPYATPLVYQQQPIVSGYVNKEIVKLLKGSASMIASGLGSGRIILIADSPSFRGFWFGTDRILLNSVFFGQIVDPATLQKKRPD